MVRADFSYPKSMGSQLASSHSLIERLSQPVTGLTLSVLMAITGTVPARAQLPAMGTVAPSPAAGPTQQKEAYILGPGDLIEIDIFNVPEYSGQNGQRRVLVDGTLNLPLINSVPVKGLTLQQAAKVISDKYAPFLTRPIVTLTLKEPRPLNIGVAGEVNRPGSYSLSLIGVGAGGTGQGIQVPTVTRALQMAGGITQAADLRRIQVRRPQVSGAEEIINIDLWALLQTGDLRQDLGLRDGDTIFVPTATNVNLAEASQLSTTSFSGDPTRPLKIAVVGEVNSPGSYTIQRVSDQGAQLGLITVTRAIETAGGITQTADVRRIQVRRPTKEGVEKVIDVNLWQLLQSGDLSQDMILDQGDTVVIPPAENIDLTEAPQLATASFSPKTIAVNVVGEVVRPGAVQVPPNTSLNQALLAAGGFNNTRARKGEVELIRLNPNGTVARRTVKVDFSQELNEETNPALRPNDVIVVGRSGVASFSDTLGTVLSPLGGVFSIFNIFRLFQ
ncbi:MAG: SLBB domain-containing protein [Oscillatoria sp. Prado101]|jgi:polysaccharide export outer membrane protein|nr:SLBB domain-containing protein [Oscillatoria sp. Prado101]